MYFSINFLVKFCIYSMLHLKRVESMRILLKSESVTYSFTSVEFFSSASR